MSQSKQPENTQWDVLVVGKGNAALCAAHAAVNQGATVAILEAAPEDEHGGNSRFAGGVMRFTYDGLDDLKKLCDLSEEEIKDTDWESNTAEQFYDDLYRVTNFRTDPDLSEILITRSLDTMVGRREQGAHFVPNYRHQSAVTDGKRHFFGRMPMWIVGGGPGLVEDLTSKALEKGVEIFYQTRATSLLRDGKRVIGVTADTPDGILEFHAKQTVLACGGFEANAEWRTRYLGPGWDVAKVRGSRFNMGDGLKMALDIGACPYGNWSGRHAVSWERYAPEYGDITIRESSYRHSFPLSIMVNADGKRFVDEGQDFYNYTYAKYGAEVLKQPDQFAYQVFDAKGAALLRPEYGDKNVTRMVADTLEELADKMEGVNKEGFLRTVKEYNASIKKDVAFDHSIKDGRCTVDIDPVKSNWAIVLDTPPYEAYAVTCGITFTFGGLRTIPDTGQVVDVHFNPIAGLFTAGEMLGGLFYFNYPAGTGLVSGSVFGRIAGTAAGAAALSAA
ncbi:MAG: FAD-dependent tricarballylate dehydrogenase TcuA [Rhodospirillales bacterium]